MCGRYQFTVDQCEEIRRIVQEVQARSSGRTWKPGEICPTAWAPVLMEQRGRMTPQLMQWGYRLPNTLVINARVESAMEKTLFRESVAQRRCVIPSTGFYEWDRDKRKYLFQLPGEDILYMAGLYEVRQEGPCYCILTTAANPSMQPIHHRMPLVVSSDDMRKWLGSGEAAAELLKKQPPALAAISVEPQTSLW